MFAYATLRLKVILIWYYTINILDWTFLIWIRIISHDILNDICIKIIISYDNTIIDQNLFSNLIFSSHSIFIYHLIHNIRNLLNIKWPIDFFQLFNQSKHLSQRNWKFFIFTIPFSWIFLNNYNIIQILLFYHQCSLLRNQICF